MSTAETMAKMSPTYKYSLFTVYILSVVTLFSGNVHTQTIEEQQPVSDPVEDYIDAINNVEAGYSAYSTEH